MFKMGPNGDIILYWDWTKMWSVMKHFVWPIWLPVWAARECFKWLRAAIVWCIDPENKEDRRTAVSALALGFTFLLLLAGITALLAEHYFSWWGVAALWALVGYMSWRRKNLADVLEVLFI